MTGTQIAILLLSLACILNAINCMILKHKNKLIMKLVEEALEEVGDHMKLVEEALEEVGDQLKDNLFFSKQLKESYKKLSDLLDSTKKG